MLSQPDIRFLQQKIIELGSALFFSMNNAVLKMPNTVIYALKVDEKGQIWFMVRRPAQEIRQFDKEFPARLDFFRKGKQYFVKIHGKASIIDDPEELNSIEDLPTDIKNKVMDQSVLLKVVVEHADYHEVTPGMAKNWLSLLRAQFRKWLHNFDHGNQLEPDLI